MLGEILTVLNIVKAVIDIWDRVKPAQTAESARQAAQQTQQQADAQQVEPQSAATVIRTLKRQVQQQLGPDDAEALLADVKYRWVLESIKTALREQRGWNVIDAPEFLLGLEKVTSLGQLATGHYMMGFVSGLQTAQGVLASSLEH